MRIGAIFDLDGTIIDNSSERTFVRYLLLKRELKLSNLAHWAGNFLRTRSLQKAKANKVYLRNRNYEHIQQLAKACFAERLVQHISPIALKRIQSHKEQGHLVVLLSGSLEILVVNFHEYLEMDMMIGYTLEVQDGRLTGRTVGLHPYDKNKALLTQQIVEQYDLDLTRSYAYGNNYSDAHKLSLVGNPVAVNPDRKLRRIARERGWSIEMFSEASGLES